jgi:hypothetical protein
MSGHNFTMGKPGLDSKLKLGPIITLNALVMMDGKPAKGYAFSNHAQFKEVAGWSGSER